MFGFHSFSEAPFSAQAGVSQSGAAILQASGEVISSGSLYINSQSAINNSGVLTSNSSLYINSQNLLESSGELNSNGTLYITSQSLLDNSGELISNNTLVVSAAGLLENSGILTADSSAPASGASILSSSGSLVASSTVVHGAACLLEASGLLSSDGSIAATSATLKLNSGTLTTTGSLRIPGSSLVEGVATLSALGTMGVDSASLLLHAGTLISNGTLIHGGQLVLDASGALNSNGSNAVTSTSITVNSGTITSNGTLYLASDSIYSASGQLTSTPSLYNVSQSLLEASGSLNSNGTMDVDGAALLLDIGTLTARGSLIYTTSSLLESSGTLSAKSVNSQLFHGGGGALVGSGIITPTATLINNGKSSIIGSGELLPGASLITISDSVISGSGTLTSSIMALRGIKSVVGITYDEFAKTTQRLNYKPALPRLQNNDIALDFAINEGAGNVFSSTSRRQKGTTGNLSWGRVDGRMSLTSPGGANDYRITASSNGLNFDNTTIYISFKPTVRYPFNVFLFNMRGTGSNNNEIDIYCITNQQKLFIDVYDGATLQRTEISNVSINTWHNLAVTIGTDLKAYLNGDLQATYPSIVLPSVIGSNIYVGGTAGNDQAFRGSIDHFRWYNRQLSAIEVANLSKNISQDYYFNNLVPNHYEMSRVTGGSPVLSHNLACLLSGQGAIVRAFPWLGGASFESSGTLSANGVILNELDVVPFTTYINQVYNKTMNVNRLYNKPLEK